MVLIFNMLFWGQPPQMRAGDCQQLLDGSNTISLGCIAVTITKYSPGSTKSRLCLWLSAYHSRALIMGTLSCKTSCNNCKSFLISFWASFKSCWQKQLRSQETDQLCFSKLPHDLCNMGSKFLDLEFSQYNIFTARSQNSLSKPSGETVTCVSSFWTTLASF